MDQLNNLLVYVENRYGLPWALVLMLIIIGVIAGTATTLAIWLFSLVLRAKDNAAAGKPVTEGLGRLDWINAAAGIDPPAKPIAKEPKEVADPCVITQGGGAHFGDDLWTCTTCGRQKYPEVFSCPKGRVVPFMVLPHNPWTYGDPLGEKI